MARLQKSGNLNFQQQILRSFSSRIILKLTTVKQFIFLSETFNFTSFFKGDLMKSPPSEPIYFLNLRFLNFELSSSFSSFTPPLSSSLSDSGLLSSIITELFSISGSIVLFKPLDKLTSSFESKREEDRRFLLRGKFLDVVWTNSCLPCCRLSDFLFTLMV